MHLSIAKFSLKEKDSGDLDRFSIDTSLEMQFASDIVKKFLATYEDVRVGPTTTEQGDDSMCQWPVLESCFHGSESVRRIVGHV